MLSIQPLHDLHTLAPRSNEEADSCMVLHVSCCMYHGHRHMFIHTVDTDVVVLGVFAISQQLAGCQLWLAYTIAKSFQYLAARQIAASLGPEMLCVLPMFHALAGCDIVYGTENSMKVTAGTTDACKWTKGDPRRCSEHY